MANLPIMRFGVFPEPLYTHLPAWFPDQVEELMLNENVPAEHLLGHLGPRTKIDPAVAMIERGGIGTAQAVLDSREKRDGTISRLLYGYTMNADAQARFVTKSLSETMADELLAKWWVGDEAGAAVARRASPARVLEWITAGVGLGDDAVKQLLESCLEREPGMFAQTDHAARLAWLCLERPSLRSALLESLAFDQLQGVVAAGFGEGDEARFLARMGEGEASKLDLRVVARALKQPSLSEAGATTLWAKFAPSTTRRSRLMREGACDPGSGIFTGTPIEKIERREVLAMLASTQMIDEEPPFCAVQLTQLGRNRVVGNDEMLCTMVMLRIYQTGLTARWRHWLLCESAAGLMRSGSVLWDDVEPGAYSNVDLWHNGRADQRKRREEILAREEDLTPSGNRMSYRASWATINEIPSEEFAAMPLDTHRVSPSRIALTASYELAEAFGDGSEQTSLEHWRLALSMIPKHKGTMRQLITSVRALVA